MRPGSAALLSCLGFPGWGGVHLIMPSRADPPGLAGRLELCQEGGDLPLAPGLLLPALLRRCPDLQPLDPAIRPWAGVGPGAWPEIWGHRYVLVCRWGSEEALRISAWQRQGATSLWIRACRPMAVAAFRQQFLKTPEGESVRRES